MRILFDSQIFRIQKFGGVSRYCSEIIHGLIENRDYQVLPKKFFSNNKYLSSLGLTKYNFIKNAKGIPLKKYIENFIRRREDRFLFQNLRQGSFDIYHPTYYNPGYLRYLPKDKPLIVTIHDMTYELYYDKQFKKIHQESLNKKNIIKNARHIIAVSENTKKDIIQLYPELDPDSITVIYHGSSLIQHHSETNIILPPKYLLYVGKRGKYKNFNWLLHSIAEFLNENKISLVCAGGRPFSEEEKNLISALHVNGKVSYVDINNDRDLATIYKKAACFIYPSSHEGFGIPILEAYSCGCPTLLAAASCFPEIGANGASYFENGNKSQLIDQLDSILNDAEHVATLKDNGFERLKSFSWERSVQQHMDVYTKILSQYGK